MHSLYQVDTVSHTPEQALAQRVVVEGTFSDGHQEDLTSKAKITSSDTDIVGVNVGVLVAVLVGVGASGAAGFAADWIKDKLIGK